MMLKTAIAVYCGLFIIRKLAVLFGVTMQTDDAVVQLDADGGAPGGFYGFSIKKNVKIVSSKRRDRNAVPNPLPRPLPVARTMKRKKI